MSFRDFLLEVFHAPLRVFQHMRAEREVWHEQNEILGLCRTCGSDRDIFADKQCEVCWREDRSAW